MPQRELPALKWQDVDFENPSLGARRTVSEGWILLGEPKTKKSRRTVQLNEAAVQALREHLARRIEQMERLVDLHKDQGIVFASKLGSATNPTDARDQVRTGSSLCVA